MSVEIDIVYQGQLRCVATHGPSGTRLETDAPKDNMGRGESFSPTDLVATALGTCLVTIMGIVAQRDELDISGAEVHIEKHMAAAPTRRIARLPVRIRIPAEKAAKLTDQHRKKLENAARTCPVHASLHPDVDAPIEFVYD